MKSVSAFHRGKVGIIFNRCMHGSVQKLYAHLEVTTTPRDNAVCIETDKMRRPLKECQKWEREVMPSLAQQRIELDLDDEVKTNYLKFPGLLAKIPGLEKKEE